MKAHYSSFAVANGLHCNYPTTNARDILNYNKLIERLNPVVKTDWFSIVAQTLVLYSAMAPLSIRRFDKLYFPATDCFETWFPYDAQTPALDDLLRWADLTTVHHGYIHRHLKYPLVTRFCREHGLRIQSCFLPSMYDCKSDFAFGYNCSHCEKCSYTIAGLSMLGIDPHGYGFTLISGTWAKMLHNLETKQWKAPLNAHVHCFWLPLQRALPSNVPNIRGSEDFFKWFRTAEL
jgi:hypothetical protein